MFPAELGGGVQASIDLADHLKFELTAVIPSWHLGSFAVQSAYLLTGAKCLGLWSGSEGSLHLSTLGVELPYDAIRFRTRIQWNRSNTLLGISLVQTRIRAGSQFNLWTGPSQERLPMAAVLAHFA